VPVTKGEGRTTNDHGSRVQYRSALGGYPDYFRRLSRGRRDAGRLLCCGLPGLPRLCPQP
jgi:hypothetical protein